MSVSNVSLRAARPVQRLSGVSGQARITTLEQSLVRLAAQYRLKPDQPSLERKTLEIQLSFLDKGEFCDFFDVSPWLVNAVKQYALRYSGREKPIVLDIGGGSSSSHLRFAEAGIISVCVDPAAEVLEKSAQRQGMVKLAEGVWKDRRLDHYLVVGDARTAAEIFGIDSKHPVLRSLAAERQSLLKDLMDIGRNFDPEKIDDRLFPEDLKYIAEYEEALRRGGNEGARKTLTRQLKGARGRLIQHKQEHYRAENWERIESLIEQLQDTDNQIENMRLEVLRSADEPLIDLVFNGYMPSGRDFTPEIRSLVARIIVYIASAGGSTGVSGDLTDFRFFPLGFYDRSYRSGESYLEEINKAYTEIGPTGEYEVRHHSLIVQTRKGLAPSGCALAVRALLPDYRPGL